MRANTSRGGRLRFDQVAEAYEAGRPKFDRAVVDLLTTLMSVDPPSDLLEVGAGTGQLTLELIAAGYCVVALEPGRRLATILRDSLGDASSVVVDEVTFEEFAPSKRFNGLVSANAFHWVDPAVGYSKAADVILPGGGIGLVWNFPVLADRPLREELNRVVFRDELADLAREPDAFESDLEQVLGEGRDELRGSGKFEEPRWTIVERARTLRRTQLVDLMNSFANAVWARDLLQGRIEQVLAESDAVAIRDYIYLCGARVA